MKSSRLLALLCLLPLIALWGCEGERGPAGPAGTDATGAPLTCLDCHNTPAQNAISQQYDRSRHAFGEYVELEGGSPSCGVCHGGNGFVEYMDNGVIDSEILTPTPITCNSCHTIHASFEDADYSLRGTDPVTIIRPAAGGITEFDFGDNSNLCANCHQARTAPPAIDGVNGNRVGPHHGPQANFYSGFGMGEIPGSTPYPTSSIHVNAGATCVTCHMGTYTEGTGGHTWEANLANCNNASCHPGLDTFDYQGVQTEVQTKVDQLRDLLVELGAVDYIDDDVDDNGDPIAPYYERHRTLSGETLDDYVAMAVFNWVSIAEEPGVRVERGDPINWGVHNPRYYQAILNNSIEAMTALLP